MTQLEELKKALEEKRQPVCVDCNQPLDTVTQYLMDWVEWTWDEAEKRYVKSQGSGDAEMPIHHECQSGDWDFVDTDSDHIALGLTW